MHAIAEQCDLQGLAHSYVYANCVCVLPLRLPAGHCHCQNGNDSEGSQLCHVVTRSSAKHIERGHSPPDCALQQVVHWKTGGIVAAAAAGATIQWQHPVEAAVQGMICWDDCSQQFPRPTLLTIIVMGHELREHSCWSPAVQYQASPHCRHIAKLEEGGMWSVLCCADVLGQCCQAPPRHPPPQPHPTTPSPPPPPAPTQTDTDTHSHWQTARHPRVHSSLPDSLQYIWQQRCLQAHCCSNHMVLRRCKQGQCC